MPVRPLSSTSDQFVVDPEGVYRCRAFDQFGWQRHGFGSRRGNPAVDVTLRQIHSDEVRTADELRDREAEGDALVTARAGLTIGVRTADCVPILMLDKRTRAIAAIHAGWRGTAAEIVGRTVRKLAADFGSSPSDLYAAIGPSIRSCCYEVGPEVAARLRSFLPELEAEADDAGKVHVDLGRANSAQLLASGVPPDQIFDSGLCTSCYLTDFYSYRQEPHEPGRMLAAITRLI